MISVIKWLYAWILDFPWLMWIAKDMDIAKSDSKVHEYKLWLSLAAMNNHGMVDMWIHVCHELTEWIMTRARVYWYEHHFQIW